MSPAEMAKVLSEAVIDIGGGDAEPEERVASGEGRVNSGGEGRVPSSEGRDQEKEGKGMMPSLLSRIFSKRK